MAASGPAEALRVGAPGPGTGELPPQPVGDAGLQVKAQTLDAGSTWRITPAGSPAAGSVRIRRAVAGASAEYRR
ncbi:hypothetical protein GCM10009738_60300 [Kitasatospora viridis]